MPRASCIKNSAWKKSNQKDMLKIQIKIETKKNILKVYEVVYEDFGKVTCLHPVILLKLDSITGFFLEISWRVTNSNSAEQLCTAGYLNNGCLWSFRIIILHKSLTSSTMEFKKTSVKGKFKIQEFHLSNAVPIDLQCRFIVFSNSELGRGFWWCGILSK